MDDVWTCGSGCGLDISRARSGMYCRVAMYGINCRQFSSSWWRISRAPLEMGSKQGLHTSKAAHRTLAAGGGNYPAQCRAPTPAPKRVWWLAGRGESWEVRLMFGEPWRGQLPVHTTHGRRLRTLPGCLAARLSGYLHGLPACASRICPVSQPVAPPAAPRTNTNAPPTTESEHPRYRYGTRPSGGRLHRVLHAPRCRPRRPP